MAAMAASPPAPLWKLLWRGARRRCPRCGEGRLFSGWYTQRERCASCELLLDPNNESLGLFFASTAALTGLFFFLLYLIRPSSPEAAQLWLIPVALVAYVGSMPMRKGIAIALSYWLRGPVRV